MAKEKSKKLSGKKSGSTGPGRALSPFEEMDRWFDEEFPHRWMRRFGKGWPSIGEFEAALERRVPKIDVIDKKNKIILRAEIPGVEKEDLDVTVSDNAVTIKGETRHEKSEGEKGDYYRSEISSSAFLRRVSLPEVVDEKSAKAKLKNGVLELVFRKAGKSKRRNVKVD